MGNYESNIKECRWAALFLQELPLRHVHGWNTNGCNQLTHATKNGSWQNGTCTGLVYKQSPPAVVYEAHRLLCVKPTGVLSCSEVVQEVADCKPRFVPLRCRHVCARCLQHMSWVRELEELPQFMERALCKGCRPLNAQ